MKGGEWTEEGSSRCNKDLEANHQSIDKHDGCDPRQLAEAKLGEGWGRVPGKRGGQSTFAIPNLLWPHQDLDMLT